MANLPQPSDEARFRELLLHHFPSLSAAQAAALWAHYALLVRWNRVLNLTTIRKLEEVVVRHYCESLFLGQHLAGGPVLDVGSGAGFPGIPCAVLRPEIEFTLCESHQRKAVFLREGTRELSNVRVESRRAEEIAAGFGVVISRAVRWQDVLPLVRGQVALLLGAEDAGAATAAAGFDWKPALSLPWRESSVLVLGSRV